MKIRLFTIIGVLISVCLFGQTPKSFTPPPILQGLAGQDIVICKDCPNNSTQVGNSANAYCSYQWFEDGSVFSTLAMPTVCPIQTTTYEIIVTDDDGNAWRDEITIVVSEMTNYLLTLRS